VATGLEIELQAGGVSNIMKFMDEGVITCEVPGSILVVLRDIQLQSGLERASSCFVLFSVPPVEPI
jgi:hypothetical protein